MAVTALRRARHAAWTAAVAFAFVPALLAQGRVTSPKEQFGWTIGDDYRLVTYSQLSEYWKKLDGESDRLKLVSIGKSAEGREQWMMIVTSPANFAKLERYKEIAGRLARAEGLTDEQAHALAREGKAVIWIDGGLHATEVLGAQQLLEHVWQMASMSDPETLRLLDDVIQLVVTANPDGMELVSSWYMRRADEKQRTTGGLPRLYQKYVGHDNNRDHYMNAQPESENMSRELYREWYPQIMYNHHQTGPAGTVIFAPPFRDPNNYFFDPLVVDGLSLVGAAMHSRFSAEGKGGVVERDGASYQTWWNGGLRTTAYFHNMVGILTEAIGNPTPITIPLVPERQLASGTLPMPIAPQPWRFRQSIDYEITANRAILDLASRYRETFLYNIYVMGRNSIARGNTDSWTTTPREIDALKEQVAKDRPAQAAGGQGGFGGGGGVDIKYMQMLRRPEDRDPRGYILPADQPDFLTATKFVNALMKSGIDVHAAKAPFAVAGKQYPAGSYVVKLAQAFRPHVLDMFEPQDYPNDISYPGGPPKAPYDNAGYTLAYQMGVKFDRIIEGFDGPFEKLKGPIAKPPVTSALGSGRAYVIDRRINDGFLAVNRLLAANVPVQVLSAPLSAGGTTFPAGSWYVPAGGQATAVLRKLSDEKGLTAVAVNTAAGAGAAALRPIKVGLWDQFGGSMPSGWVRWMLEQFEFPFEVVYPQRLDAGNLKSQFDVLVFVDGGIPAAGGGGAGQGGGGFGGGPPADLPDNLKATTGRVTAEKTIPQLKSFLEAGGRVVTIGSSIALAQHLGLPVGDYLVERTPEGRVRSIPREKFYIPASLLEVAVNTGATSALGMEDKTIVMFDESPVMRLAPDAEARGVKPVAWFASASPLRSGWAWGQTYLEGGIAMAEARVGQGTLYLFGPEITFRSQPHGTYKFLFNSLYGR